MKKSWRSVVGLIKRLGRDGGECGVRTRDLRAVSTKLHKGVFELIEEVVLKPNSHKAIWYLNDGFVAQVL